ncbi:hypothetical protein BDP27DRAFT_796648 [Rhodocollybia butyracea]|uniref:Uncharacterized protein n=1 Tax=Rhodocollybia butyracea TaxID=206335 RepID=A0A9P5Q1J3_9AGAR|nr:hypothetical protein BDP27DRAFT_796648 [Rhodocollybia butyracea]
MVALSEIPFRFGIIRTAYRRFGLALNHRCKCGRFRMTLQISPRNFTKRVFCSSIRPALQESRGFIDVRTHAVRTSCSSHTCNRLTMHKGGLVARLLPRILLKERGISSNAMTFAATEAGKPYIGNDT